VREFLASKQITVLEHPPYSPDLAAMTFISPKIKEIFKGRHFDNFDDVRNKAIPQNQSKIVFKGELGASIVHSFLREVL
jgi:transposase